MIYGWEAPWLTLQTYAHTIRDEEMGLSIADFTTDSSTERPYTAPDILDGAAKGNAPDLTDRGRFERLEHETGLEPAEALAVASSATAPPHVGKVSEASEATPTYSSCVARGGHGAAQGCTQFSTSLYVSEIRGA